MTALLVLVAALATYRVTRLVATIEQKLGWKLTARQYMCL